MIAKANTIAPDQQALIDHQQRVTDYHLAIAASRCGQWTPWEVEGRRRKLIESCKALLMTLEQ